MLIKRITQLLIVFTVFSFTAKSQTKATLVKTMYSYTFSGANAAVNSEELTREIESLKGVTTCKVVLKPEKEVGQLIVFVEEYSRTSEGQEMFQITDLKKIITENGLIPNELTIEPINN